MVRKTTRKVSKSNASRMSAAMRKGKAGMRTTSRASKSAMRSARSYIKRNPKKVAAVAVGLLAAGTAAVAYKRRSTQKARAR